MPTSVNPRPSTAPQEPRRALVFKKRSRLVAEEIVRDIGALGWRPQAELGTESELIGRYGVSRATLREAVRELERQGAVAMRRGVGLVVAAPARESVVAALAGFIRLSDATPAHVAGAQRLLSGHLVTRAMSRDVTGLQAALADAPAGGAPARLLDWLDAVERRLRESARSPVLALLLDSLADLDERASRLPAVAAAADRARDLPPRVHGLMDIQPVLEIFELLAQPGSRRLAVAGEKLGQATALKIACDISRRPIGTRLGTEADFLATYDVSRATLREALSLLETSGILARRRGFGGGLFRERADPAPTVETAVTYLRFLKLEAQQFTDAREAIEPAVAALAAERASEADVAALGESLERCRGVGAGDPEYGRLFHLQLADCSGNPVLSLFVQVLMHAFYQLPGEGAAPGFFEELYRTHAQILDAVAARDTRAASAAMLGHLEFADRCMRTGAIAV